MTIFRSLHGTFFSFFLLSFLVFSIVAQAREGEVIVSIKPLHALVAAVMGDTGTPALIVSGSTSPHDFQMRPSQMRLLEKAQMIFYIDPRFEAFLENALEALPPDVEKAAVIEGAQLPLLRARKGGAWEAHVHEHGKEHDHTAHEHDEESQEDLHVWLDPQNAKKIVAYIAQKLSAKFPQNTTLYQKNAQALNLKLEALDHQIQKELSGTQNIPFIVFHDAFQYYEKRYGLSGVGSLTFEPEELPSLRRLREVRAKLKETKAHCVFREPFFSEKFIHTVTEDTTAKSATLDPEATALQPGPELYFTSLKTMTQTLKACLTSQGNTHGK